MPSHIKSEGRKASKKSSLAGSGKGGVVKVKIGKRSKARR